MSRCGWAVWTVVLGGQLLAAAGSARAQSTAAQVPTDWDLYMMKLVNRARTDPLGEDTLQETSYNETAVPPLAYDLIVGRAAQNHNEWMGLNRNNAAIDNAFNDGAPESFSHCETYDNHHNCDLGTAADDTPGYSGNGPADRFDFVNFDWSAAAENIIWRSNTPTFNTSLIDDNHDLWWTSEGHRDNMMWDAVTVFGHHIMNDDNHWATQAFGLPGFFDTQNFFLGVIFEDMNDNANWDPKDAADPNREGLPLQSFQVFDAGTTNQVASGVTMDNGAFSIPIENGIYDVQFYIDSLDEFQTFEDVVMSDANVDLGDFDINDLIAVLDGDMDCDGDIDLDDVDPFVLALTDAPAYTSMYQVPPEEKGDIDGDGDNDLDDVDGFVALLVGSPGAGAQARHVPEPTTWTLLAVALLAMASVRRHVRNGLDR